VVRYLSGCRQGKAAVWLVLVCCTFLLLLSGCMPLQAEKTALLTPEERQWLVAHVDELTVVTSNWPPYEFFEPDGTYRGYVADYVELLQKKLGVRFQIIPTKTWVEAEQMALNHRVAMITTIKYSPERARYLNFAGPFRVVPISIITRDSEQGSISLDKLAGKKVAYVEGYFTGEAMRQSYPKIMLEPVPDDRAGVRLLSLGGADAIVSDVGVVAYYTQREGITNLRVAGDTNYQYVLNIGVRKDWTILAEILQKGMNAISPAEDEQLYQKWMTLKGGKPWESKEFWLIVAGILAVAMIAIGLVSFWNRSLRVMVRQRTDALATSEAKYRSIFDNAISGIFQSTVQGTIVSANSAFARMLGYDSPEELIDSFSDAAIQGYVNAKVREEFLAQLFVKRQVENFEAELYRKDHSTVWIMVNANLVLDAQGEIRYIEGTCADISDRKRAERQLLQYRDGLEQLVEERTQALSAANQELAAMNEEMSALNDNLTSANQKLNTEVEQRISIEHGLVLRETQYQTAMNLLIGAATEIEQFLATILRDALMLIKAPGGTIGLVDEQDRYVIRHAYGNADDLAGLMLPAGQGLFGQVRLSGDVVHIADYRQYEHRFSDERLQRQTTLVMVPLKQYGKVIGSFSAVWTVETCSVSAGEIEILRQYGNLASVALERTNAQKQMTRMAFQDPLTGLPNRARLNQRLAEEMRRAQQGEASGILLFIDLDDLKMVNDNFGHTCGDSVIISAGMHIVAAMEPSAFIARMGGDEFVVLLPGVVKREQASLIADQLVQSLQGEYDLCGRNLHLTASVGVALYPQDADTVEEILKAADSAMYAAKAAGRNCWRFFETAMRDEVYSRMIMTSNLRHALEQGELALQYQPQLGLSKDAVIGFEALARWNSAEHGAVSPARFIWLAEQSGLIQPIGEWVLRQACRFARRLADMGHGELHVAVNISPRQLEMADFVSTVHAAVADAGISPAQLELEITESTLIDSLEDSFRKLNELRDMGIRLSLDDFGTGFSSLTYLRRLPVQTLKIDKSFIDGVGEDTVQHGFVASIIEMAHVLGLFVVAEGVETAAQQQLLAVLGCDCLQGYYFCRPIDETAAIRFLESKKTLAH
jgi:diguanylate cyclase (GGDEF)-like protein/PAS domain S-box-containing protein